MCTFFFSNPVVNPAKFRFFSFFPLATKNVKYTSISSIIGPPHKLSMIWIFSAHSVSPNRQKIKTSNIFFFQKKFLRARKKKIKHPKIWGLCLLSLVQKKIYRNFSNEHSSSQKSFWRARAVPIHQFCASNIFFLLKIA